MHVAEPPEVYFEAEVPPLMLGEKDQEQVKLLIAAATRSTWWKESLVVAIVMTGAGFVVYDYIPTRITSQTSGDISALKTSVEGLKTDVSGLRSDVTALRNDIKDILTKALDRASSQKTAAVEPSHREAQASLEAGSTALELAEGLKASLDRSSVSKFGMKAIDLSLGSSDLQPVAWKTAAAALNYASSMMIAPTSIEWVSLPATLPGFPGLFGITEMADVREFGSKQRVPLDRAFLMVTAAKEGEIVAFVKSMGYTTWPEFGMLVGTSKSNIVLDNLHFRNVIVVGANIIYGGGPTVLRNVTFVNCTFDLSRANRSFQLARQLLSFGPVDLS